MSGLDDKIKELLEKAESLFNKGKYKEAIEVLSEANELKPKDYKILRLLGDSYYLLHNIEKCLDYFVEAMELKSNSLSPWIEYADEYCSIGKYEKAEKLILKAIELYPNSCNTYNFYNFLGYLYFKQCQYDKSMDNFIEASKLYLYNYAIWAELEDRCELKGLYEKSIDYLNKAIKSDNDNHAIYHSLLGISYFKIKKYNEAIISLSKAIELNFNNSQMIKPSLLSIRYDYMLYNMLGHSYYETKEYEKAKDYFAEAIKLNPNDNDSKKMLEKIENLIKNK